MWAGVRSRVRPLHPSDRRAAEAAEKQVDVRTHDFGVYGLSALEAETTQCWHRREYYQPPATFNATGQGWLGGAPAFPAR